MKQYNDYDEEDYERRSLAKTFLFELATAMTNGHRNKEDA